MDLRAIFSTTQGDLKVFYRAIKGTFEAESFG